MQIIPAEILHDYVQYPHFDNGLHVVEGEKLGGGLSRTHKYFFSR